MAKCYKDDAPYVLVWYPRLHDGYVLNRGYRLILESVGGEYFKRVLPRIMTHEIQIGYDMHRPERFAKLATNECVAFWLEA